MNPLADIKAAQVAATQRYADELLDVPVYDEVSHDPGGVARAAWLGRVTKRYGDFVSVEEIEGDVHSPTRATTGRGEVHYIWAGPAHPWLAEKVSPPISGDLLTILPLARSMTATRIEKDGRLIFDEDEKAVTINVQWVALGTVPEMDPDTFGGVATPCVFDPDEPLEDCMFEVLDDTPPAVIAAT